MTEGPAPGGALVPRAVHVPPALFRAMLEQAAREAPDECCGLLIGTPAAVVGIHPARNELASATRYRVDPTDHFAAIRRARAAGLMVVGAYHSHPRTAPMPSATDAAEAWEEFLYLIVSLHPAYQPEPCRGWRLQGRNFVEVPLVTDG